MSLRIRAPASLKGLLLVGLLLAAAGRGYALGGPSYVTFSFVPEAFPLVQKGAAAPLWLAPDDWAGVIRAAHDLQADVKRVSGVRPELVTTGKRRAPAAVIIGTVGHSALIDGLVRAGKLDVAAIRGRWEAYLHQTVEHPLPGVDRALVIAGSDKRGTIYGIYDLSAQIGVSPWYWWADVTPTHHADLFIDPGRLVNRGPAVKYRGIFLNDEAPDLTNWVGEKYGNVAPRKHPPIPPGVANYGHRFYERVFELILRLGGNYLWPAMWNNAFNEDDPMNPRLANEYGVVMGTSHQEPMLRAQKEWDRRYHKTLGPWNFYTHPKVLEHFWRAGIRRNRKYESIITIGLRGENDTPMAPGGPAASETLLEKIVHVQRRILAQEMNPDVARIPQVWCLYKEVQKYYAAGMRVPGDVTLLWCDDNWGNLRRVPTAEERTRSGGAGIYYHFDYHGGPRSYQWINSNPLPKIWDQMRLAHQYGANRIWIVNVGHLKGYELPTQFFMDLAWNPDRWKGTNLDTYTRNWAAQNFGPAHAVAIAEILTKYTNYNGRRKPELLRPDTYSLVNYHEAKTVVADYNALVVGAETIDRELPANKREAFYELVLFPTKASALLNKLYLAAGLNALYARQGRASANYWATETRRLFQSFQDLMHYYNHTFADGRWDHFMDQAVLGYTSWPPPRYLHPFACGRWDHLFAHAVHGHMGWAPPRRNSLRAIALKFLQVPDGAAMGVAVEGSTAAWPGAPGGPSLPQIDAFNRQQRYIDVFDKGRTPFAFSATADQPWIKLGESGGTVETGKRLWVGVDWNRAPKGVAHGTVVLSGAGRHVRVRVNAFNPTAVTRDTLQGFVEGDGYVSMDADHYSKKTDASPRRWTPIEDYGPVLSGMRATAPTDAPAAVPGRDAPCLEYRMYLFHAGKVRVTARFAPSLNFIPHRAVHYAVAFDHQPPRVVTLIPAGYDAENGNVNWEHSVEINGRLSRTTLQLAQPGYHVLKVWMVDPGVVLEKLVVDLGGVRPSSLGPPESFRRPVARRGK